MSGSQFFARALSSWLNATAFGSGDGWARLVAGSMNRGGACSPAFRNHSMMAAFSGRPRAKWFMYLPKTF